MHKGKYVFSQLLDFLDKDVFLRLVNKYNGNRYVKQFTCWNQLAVLMFGQLLNRESLRDVVLLLRSTPARHSTLASESMHHRVPFQTPTTSATIVSSRSLLTGL